MATADFHMHTSASFDAEMTAEQACDAAIAAEIAAIAITDHVEMVPDLAGDADSVAQESWNAASRVREQYGGQLRVARSIELGEPLYDLPHAQKVLARYAYDYVLASQHTTESGVDYYHYDYTGADIGEVMDAYFASVLRLVEWGKFHTLAHLTYPFRYMPPERRPSDYTRWQPAIDAIFRTMVARGLALEINTSGLRGPIGCTQPDAPLIRRFRELGGQYVTLGSDAHFAKDVGAGLAEAVRLAQDAGFTAATVFFDGKRELLPF